ncbi:hypothetical protein R3W88_011673 [Solanum pinnatisectum]|uniref:Uncharacterized protein n=1 Tax=Solanum pinnatisectum TaxID=50273 RepID=A0AAV9L982_9SOLN|nr:hypothetical protein R3W88_011673 [Solanum pinnatisectum]
MTYSRLSELDTTRDNWLVRRGNEMINLDMVLINEKVIKTHVNFPMDNINSLIQKIATINIPMEEAMFVNRMTVSELLDSDWSYNIEECMVTRRAQITEIDTFFDWYYICYNGGKTTLDLFNGQPSQTEALCSKEFVFKLKLSKYNLKEGLENYTVTKIYLPDEQLELQHRINKDKKFNNEYAFYSIGKTQNGRYATTTCPECRSSHTYTSKENAGEGEGTSSSNIRVNARKLKKRRKFLIDERYSDEATNKNVNLKA